MLITTSFSQQHKTSMSDIQYRSQRSRQIRCDFTRVYVPRQMIRLVTVETRAVINIRKKNMTLEWSCRLDDNDGVWSLHCSIGNLPNYSLQTPYTASTAWFKSLSACRPSALCFIYLSHSHFSLYDRVMSWCCDAALL